MRMLRVIGMLAAYTMLAPALGIADLRAATEEEPAATPKRKSDDPKDIRVPIPSYSKDVSDNGCRVRKGPEDKFAEPDADILHVPFADLISETVSRYSVRAILDGPETFAASLAPLDADMRTLVLLDVLRAALGRDGLHTFFFLSAGVHAPAIRDALQVAGLRREHELFLRAMELFGPTYPADNETRAKAFSYSSLDTPLNDFDRRMLEVASSFGSREALGNTMVAFVERTPELWQQIEAKRAQLGEIARLRYLNQALTRRIDIWDKSDAEVAAQLASLTTEQRTLFVMDVFNTEFENGGVHQFFYNSSGAVAPEVYDALIELGLERQAAIFKGAMAIFPGKYPRDMQQRRDRFFDRPEWSDWDRQLQALTDEFYDLDGGPTVVPRRQCSGRGWPGHLVRHDHLRAREEDAALLAINAAPCARDRR
ncbi:MAG: DMP19 family protein [Hyphomicrobium sp.]|nr:DMP19 family protein [Hyphomicrobium sp.]